MYIRRGTIINAKGRNPLGELVGNPVANPGWQLVSN